MKNLNLLLFHCFLAFQLFAQNRYVEEVFAEVNVTPDIVYGANSTFFTYPFTAEFESIDLKMDVYEPIGDTFQERPLVLVLHDGSFLPPVTNGRIIGTKNDSSVVEICTQLARRGFTAAAITYRLGWNPLAASQIELAGGLIQAIYRGVQDGRTAIRFFRKNYEEENNEFHIDPNRITVWGNGTGALLALNMVALSHINDIVLTTNSPGKFIFDADGNGTPETPMVLEDIHGDIEGKNLTIAPYDFWGYEEGDTSNYENHPNYSSDFHLSVNVGGAVADIGWLDDNNIPIISIQSIFDFDYPYGDQLLVVHPGTPIFAMQGSEIIGALQENLGNNQAWKDGIIEGEPYTQQAMLHAGIAGHPYYEGVYAIVNPSNSYDYDEGVVIDWWDPNAPSPIEGPGMGLSWDEIPYPGVPDLSFHDAGLFRNENMSAEKARTNIDTIMNYFAPRACITLGLQCHGDVFPTAINEQTSGKTIQLFPNPTNGLLTINAENEIMHAIQLFDLTGKLIKTYTSINSNQLEINLSELPKGFYMANIQLGSEYVFKRIILD